MSTIELLIKILGWSALINYIVLIIWFVMYVFAKDFIYGMHSKWFIITKEQFSTIHYSGIMIYKLIIFVFNLVPYLVLRLCI